MSQDAINGALYQRPELVRLYATRTELLPAETTVLVRYRDDVVEQPVLDLGCGAGRLSAHLQLWTSRYLGVDVSPHMIRHCREQFPGLRFVVGDMRTLDELGLTGFASVFAIANLLDAVGHADRLRVLEEIHDVLAPHGLFVFSTHNRNWTDAGAPPHLVRAGGPIAQLRAGARFLRQCVHHVRAKRFEEHAEDHAVLNDPARDYELLHYYITREAQRRQLDAAGFTLLETLDGNGRLLGPFDDDRAWPSITYVARRV